MKRSVLIAAVILFMAGAVIAAIDTANKRFNMAGAGMVPSVTASAAKRMQTLEMRLPNRRMTKIYAAYFPGGGPTSTQRRAVTILYLRRLLG